mmetsp:Transcript_385/g.891  ORF Transcript_385/g.891 Transcript_385/m.891 type:complete len:85 (+) Transcript_385:755-1009(+)
MKFKMRFLLLQDDMIETDPLYIERDYFTNCCKNTTGILELTINTFSSCEKSPLVEQNERMTTSSLFHHSVLLFQRSDSCICCKE